LIITKELVFIGCILGNGRNEAHREGEEEEGSKREIEREKEGRPGCGAGRKKREKQGKMTSMMKNRKKQQEEVRKRDTTIKHNDEGINNTYIPNQHLKSL
jgi:hypothetical protein